MHERAAEFGKRARERYGIDVEIQEFPEGTKTAQAAADAIGCDLAQIASSIALTADELVVVVTSGANRVSEGRLARRRGVPAEDVEMADADTIKSVLGWSIGGVPPFCHDADVPTYVDETLTEFDTVWAAAGTPEAVFPVDPNRIVDLTDASVVDVTE